MCSSILFHFKFNNLNNTKVKLILKILNDVVGLLFIGYLHIIHIYLYLKENNVPSQLSPKWLYGNSCTWNTGCTLSIIFRKLLYIYLPSNVLSHFIRVFYILADFFVFLTRSCNKLNCKRVELLIKTFFKENYLGLLNHGTTIFGLILSSIVLPYLLPCIKSLQAESSTI